MKILLADDHAMVRSGLNLLLTRLFNDVQIVEAGDYSQALQLCRDSAPFSLILVDLMMPGMAKGGDLHALCQQAGSTPVVVLSASEDPTHVQEAISCGARGYLPKTTKEQVLFSAMQLVLSGGTYLPMTLLDYLNTESTEAVTGQRAAVNATLTPRQMDILNLIVLGKTNKDIAREFDISPATVQSHLNAIFRALAVKNRTQAVHVAGRMGLLQHANVSRASATA
jgi:DNA-binding NarL/FixJ family response regulator